MTLEIRHATPQDTSGILKLVAEVYAEYDFVLDVENDEPNLPNAVEYFRASGGNLWVIEDEGVVRGVAGVFLSGEAGVPCGRSRTTGRKEKNDHME